MSLISEGPGHRRGLRDLRQRAVRADVAAALRVPGRVPGVAPDDGDELPEHRPLGRS